MAYDLRPRRGSRPACRLAATARQAAGGVRGLRRGQDRQAAARDRAGGRPSKDSISAVRGNRRADRLRRRAVVVELCDVPGDGHARRHRPRRSPRPAAGSTSRSSPTATTGSCRELAGGPFRYKTYAADTLERVDRVRHQADEAGGHRARRCWHCCIRSTRSFRATRASSSRSDLVDECEKDIRGAFDAGAACGLDRLHRRAARAPRGFAQPVDGPRDAAALHRPDQPRARPVHRGGAGQHRGPHLPRRGSRFGAQRRRALQRPAAEPVRAERRLLPDADAERARPRGGVQARRRAQPRGRRRRGAGGLHRRDQPAEPAGRVRRRKSATSWSRPRSTSPRNGSAQPTTAGSRRSASTRSRCTARPTSPATSRSRRSPTACRARRWRPRSSASTFRLPRRRLTHGLAAT